MQVTDATCLQRGGQQGLGEAGLAGLRDRADVDENLDPVGQQTGQGGVEGFGLVAGGEEAGRVVAGVRMWRPMRLQMWRPMRPTM